MKEPQSQKKASEIAKNGPKQAKFKRNLACETHKNKRKQFLQQIKLKLGQMSKVNRCI